MKSTLPVLVLSICTLAIAAAPVSAAVVFGTDTFDAGRDGWTAWTGLSTKNFTLADIGGGDQAMTGTGQQVAIKQVNVPRQMTLDMDFAAGFASTQGQNNSFSVLFQAEPFMTSGQVATKAYAVRWVKGFNDSSNTWGFQLVERDSRWSAYKILAQDQTISFDSNPHKLRVTDDGTGKFCVYLDDMSTPKLTADDSASYTAAVNSWVAVEMGNQLTGSTSWFQNVTVYDTVTPEPVTAALLALGGVVLVRRRAAA